jgi:hypothetical protein
VAIGNLDSPLMLVDDLLHQRKPEPHAMTSTRIEHVEESVPVCCADATALVRNFEKPAAPFVATRADFDLAAMG